MTPDKRATLLKAFKWTLSSLLLACGLITAAQWGMVLLGG